MLGLAAACTLMLGHEDMKCPGCNFVCSELRDICPRCKIDMRPFKGSVGLPITNPKVKYAELVAKLEKQSRAPAREAASFVGKLFRRPPSPQPSPKSPEAEPGVTKKVVENHGLKQKEPPHYIEKRTRTLLAEDVANAGDVSRFDDGLDDLLDDIVEHSMAEAERETASLLDKTEAIRRRQPAKDEPPPPKLKSFFNPEAVAQIQPAREDSAVKEKKAVPSPPAEEVKPEEVTPASEDSSLGVGLNDALDERAPTGEFEDFKPPEITIEEDKGVLLNVSDDIQTVVETRDSNPPEIIDVPPGVEEKEEEEEEPLPDDTDKLFCRTAVDIRRAEAPLEFFPEQFILPAQKEEISILFDLTAEGIKNPDAEKVYVEELEGSESRRVEAEETVHQRMKQAEQVISAPRITVKGLRPREEREYTTSAEASPPKPLAPAGLSRRVYALFLDVLFILILSFILGCATFAVLAGSTDVLTTLAEELDIFDVLSLVRVCALWLAGLSVLYPLFAYYLWRQTLGESAAGIMAVDRGLRTLSRPQATVRALTLPLSVLLFGYLPVMFGKPTIHDQLAITEVGNVPAED